MNSQDMLLEVALSDVRLPTLLTSVRSLSVVNALVRFQTVPCCKRLATFLTSVAAERALSFSELNQLCKCHFTALLTVRGFYGATLR